MYLKIILLGKSGFIFRHPLKPNNLKNKRYYSNLFHTVAYTNSMENGRGYIKKNMRLSLILMLI